MSHYHDVFLALFFVFVALFYWVRIVFFNRSTSSKLVFFGPRYSTQWLTHRTFRIFRALILMVCVLRLWIHDVDTWIGIFPYMMTTPIVFIGDILMILGFTLVVTAHKQMQEHWRCGINTEEHIPLITSGLFAVSRNPIFIGVILAQLGFFLALPSVFSFVCLITGISMLLIQERQEEKHLLSEHGDLYKDYQQNVSRWILR